MDILDIMNKVHGVFDKRGGLSYKSLKGGREEDGKFIGRRVYHANNRPKGNVFFRLSKDEKNMSLLSLDL